MFCDIIDEAMSRGIQNHVSRVFFFFFLSLSHICSSLFSVTDGNKPVKIAFNKICLLN